MLENIKTVLIILNYYFLFIKLNDYWDERETT